MYARRAIYDQLDLVFWQSEEQPLSLNLGLRIRGKGSVVRRLVQGGYIALHHARTDVDHTFRTAHHSRPVNDQWYLRICRKKHCGITGGRVRATSSVDNDHGP
jgi:hypothetical protein